MLLPLFALLLQIPAGAQTAVKAPVVYPADGATAVPLNTSVVAVAGTVQVLLGGAPIAGTNASIQFYPWSVFTPSQALLPNTTYTVQTVLQGAASTASFTTGTAMDTTTPSLVSTMPGQGQDGALPGSNVTLHFSKVMNPITLSNPAGNGGPFSFGQIGYPAGNGAGAILQSDGMTAQLYSGPYAQALAAGAAYQLSMGSGTVTDICGNPLTPFAPLTFSTFPHPLEDGPQLIGTAPTDGEAGVATNSDVYIVFDRNLSPVSSRTIQMADSSGNSVPFTLTAVKPNALQLRPKAFTPNTHFTVSAASVYDQYGVLLQNPVSFGFRTGVGPDTTQQGIASSPPSPLPANAPIKIVFRKPIDPPLLALGGVTMGTAQLSNSLAPVPYLLSADGMSVIVNAGTSTVPGTYYINVSIPYDRQSTGSQAAGPFTLQLTVSGTPELAAPTVLAVSPPDGAAAVPLSAKIQILFSASMDFSSALPGALQVTSNSSPVPGSFSFSGGTATFTPKAPLQASATYSISATSLTDLAGNAAAPFQSAFTTGTASGYADGFNIVSINPTAGSAGVDPAAPIVLTFNHPVNPVSAYSGFTLTSQGSVSGVVTTNGTTIRFQPTYPLAPNVTASLRLGGILDLAGNNIVLPTDTFTTAAGGSEGPFQVTGTSPAQGAVIAGFSAHVQLKFSNPVDVVTIPNNFAVFQNGVEIAATPSWPSDTTVALDFSATPNASVTVTATSAVLDWAGNALTPFSANFLTAPATAPPPIAMVAQQYPQRQAPFGSSIEVVFAGPVDRQSVEDGLIVTQSVQGVVQARQGPSFGRPIPKAFSFVPATPFPYNASVYATIVPPAHDVNGAPIISSVEYAAAPHTTGVPGSASPRSPAQVRQPAFRSRAAALSLEARSPRTSWSMRSSAATFRRRWSSTAQPTCSRTTIRFRSPCRW